MKTLIFLICFLLYCPSAFANIVNSDQIYTYEQMQFDIQKLKETYDGVLEVTVIGQSYYGNDIPAIKIGKGEKNVVLIGAHHGREWLTSSLLMVMLENYARALTTGAKVGPFYPNMLNDVSIWIVPMLNPDGVKIQQRDIPVFFVDQLFLMNEGDSNFSRWKANGIGIDLNRQYPAGWRELKGPSTPTYQFYKGKRPFEALETQALAAFIDKIQPSISVAYHSTGQEIYWKYKNGKNEQRDYSIAEKIAQSTGYKLGKPPKKATGGGFTDWFITTYHRPALTIEICPPMINRAPPLSSFPEVWKRNQYVGMKLVNEVIELHKRDGHMEK
ncbi:M14 family zinc carboxypeptidase [Robertmurraya sp. GLU-23]